MLASKSARDAHDRASQLMAETNPSIPVVAAVIEDGAGRVLVAQRPAHKHLALKWEFPGGKVEANESPEAALARRSVAHNKQLGMTPGCD